MYFLKHSFSWTNAFQPIYLGLDLIRFNIILLITSSRSSLSSFELNTLSLYMYPKAIEPTDWLRTKLSGALQAPESLNRYHYMSRKAFEPTDKGPELALKALGTFQA